MQGRIRVRLGAKLARYNLKIQSALDLVRVSNSQEVEEKLNRFLACLDNTLTALEVDG